MEGIFGHIFAFEIGGYYIPSDIFKETVREKALRSKEANSRLLVKLLRYEEEPRRVIL